MNYNYDQLEVDLRTIFDNPNIHIHVTGLSQSVNPYGDPCYTIKLRVLISSFDLLRHGSAKEWNEALLSTILSGSGTLVNREISHDPMSAGLIMTYDIRVNDISYFTNALSEMARRITDNRFREAFLEPK